MRRDSCSRFSWLLLGCLGLVAVAFGQSDEIAKDPSLQTPVSVKWKIVQLPDALRRISRLTGVKLTSIAPINDLKITVMVNGMPAGQLLEKVANVLGCVWRADGNLYRLTVLAQEQTNRDRFMAAEEEDAQASLNKSLQMLAQASTLDPQAVADEMRQQIDAQRGDPNAKVKYDPDRLEMLKLVGNGPSAPLGKFLYNLSPEAVAAFWKGEVVFEPFNSPRSAPPATRGNRTRATMVPSSLMFVQLDPYLHQVRWALNGVVHHFPQTSTHLMSMDIPTKTSTKLPFAKEVSDWDQSIPTDGELSKVVVEGNVTKAIDLSVATPLANVLEQIFDKTGIPIVADGFRVRLVGPKQVNVAGPFATWLSSFKSETHVYTRFEDGVLLVRHPRFWSLRRFEAPEDAYYPLEQKIAKGGKVSLSDYATFASKLTAEQSEPFWLPGEVSARFDTSPVENGLPALQFFASLDDQALPYAVGRGISFPNLNGTQRQLFENAALEGAFLGAMTSGFSSTLSRLLSSGDGKGLGFVAQSVDISVKGQVTPGEMLLFGRTMSDGATYRLPISQ